MIYTVKFALLLFSLFFFQCLVCCSLTPCVSYNQNSLYLLKCFHSKCLKHSFSRWGIIWFVFLFYFPIAKCLGVFICCFDMWLVSTLHPFTSKYMFQEFLCRCRKLFPNQLKSTAINPCKIVRRKSTVVVFEIFS